MTITITVRACTLVELQAASPELDWTPVCRLDPGLDGAGERVRAAALGELDDTAFAAVRAELPSAPGLYAWTTAGAGGRGLPGEEAVVYLGVAAGRHGLADRLGSELRYVRNGTGRSARWRQEHYHGHPRTMLVLDAHPLYATTADGSTARRLERELLAVTGYGTGLTPLANGSSWRSSTSHQIEARSAAWGRAEAAGLLHEEPAP